MNPSIDLDAVDPSLALSKEEFDARYIQPAMTELARRFQEEPETLSEFELNFVMRAINPQGPKIVKKS